MMAKRNALFLGLVSLLVANSVLACQVPVFRYALERWPADRYEIVVLHVGALDDAAKSRLDKVRLLNEQSDLPANFDVRVMDPTDSSDQLVRSIWKQHNGVGGPLMAVLYPRNAKEVPDRIVTVLPFSDQSLKNLFDSPLRQKITKEVIGGESAVWIFVPSGNDSEDAAAMKRLTQHVTSNQQTLKLPTPEELETEEEFLEEVEIELRIGFSILTLDREDPKEAFFLKMLLASEPDLEELKQPMAFPVLGRGRVLYALVGKGINEQTIGMASRFIVGPCSCQVKEQNPGFDLLMSFNWEEKLLGSTISEPVPERSNQPKKLIIPPGRNK